ncbi:hypothetical protein A2U01_0031966, partial [Trifolium medium]|nr:hypothetical protein [Trifolium medium]
MKIVSFNMRGWGTSAKRRKLSQFLKSGLFQVCLLQETKKSDIEEHSIHNLWGHSGVEWVAKPAEGLSGGLLLLWNAGLFVVNHVINGDGFIGICVEEDGKFLYIINVYSPCNLQGKRRLWNDLLNLKSGCEEGDWCIAGDFNAISCRSERKGSSEGGRLSEWREFSLFIEAMQVVDLPVSGKKFT